MLTNGIEPEAIYHLCVDIKNERKKQQKKKDKSNRWPSTRSRKYMPVNILY